MRTLVMTGLVVAAFATFIACGGPSEPPREPSAETAAAHNEMAEKPPTTPQHPPMAATPPAQETGMEPDTSALPAPKVLSDAEIVAVTQVANKGEIDLGELAKKNASSPEVKTFAVMLVTQHRDAENKGKAISDKAKIAPAENETSTQLKSELETTSSSLKNQKGKEFDKAYIDSQVKAHRDVIDTIDKKLLPAAQNPELKSHLMEVRRHFASHLAKAEDLQQKLQAAPAQHAPKPAPAKPEKKAPKK
ncbi:MAG: DUF4142 domain-containing protein [Labilithrix sp.]|nr:DUF4142 domain-containing protein [Labilithrix sp.]